MTSKIDDIVAKHNHIVSEMNKKKKELAQEGKVAMQSAFKDFFDAIPEIKAVKWSQYTPYFNDGDECVFDVNEYHLYFEGDDTEDEGIDSWSFNSDYEPSVKRLKEQLGENYQKVKDAMPILASIFSLPNEIFLDVFDNHVQITATSEGFDVNEYYHD